MRSAGNAAACVAVIAAAAAAAGPPAEAGRLRKETLAGKRFRFRWQTKGASRRIGTAELRPDGTIAGIASPNETFWHVDERGRLVFQHRDGRASTIFTRVRLAAGRRVLTGPFLFKKGVLHMLEELVGQSAGESDLALLNRAVRRYSRQAILALDVAQERRFRRKDGSEAVIRLVSVAERRDRVIGLIRRADVVVELDGKRLALACEPYAMPTKVAGLRIQADTTSQWCRMPQRVQLSVWDAADPIVDTDRFAFPLRDYLLLSHGMQAYNEVVHLGRGDGDPEGQRFYHSYGVDLAGLEGRERVLSCTDGEIVKFWPSREKPCGLSVRDAAGLIWSYAHFHSVLPGLRKGGRVRKGQPLGLLGKTGPSGNFSHLHVGTYLSSAHVDRKEPNHRLNLYPWLVAAHQKEAPRPIYAVARPHRSAVTGERIVFDAAHCLAFAGPIASYRWVFDDGRTAAGARADRTYDRPGVYSAALWVRDRAGNEDVDFCTAKVFTRGSPEGKLPTIFVTCSPTRDVRAGRAVTFRCWLQTAEARRLTLDFGDGTMIDDYRSYAEVTHAFRTPGLHVVTARATVRGTPVTQKRKVVVGP